MSFYLLVTVIGISWQNSRAFEEMLTKQNQDNVAGIAKRGSVSVGYVLDLWASLVHSLMHNIDNFDETGFNSSIKSFLASNKDAVSFQVFSVSDKFEVLNRHYKFTDFTDSPRFEGKKPNSVSEQLKNISFRLVNTAQNAALNKEPSPFIEAVYGEVKLPILLLGYPFKIANQKSIYWAIFSVWQERVSSSLEQTAQTSSYLVDSKGMVIAARAKDMPALFGKSLNLNVKELLSKNQQFGFKGYDNQFGNPVLASFQKIQNSSLNFVVEREATMERKYIAWRIRKTALFAWIFLLFTTLASYLAAGKITKGLNVVTMATLQIAQGNLGGRSVLRSKDEVGLLSKSVNHLAKQIERLMLMQAEKTRQEHELKTAQAVQSTLFPKEDIEAPYFRTTGYYQPASECAGDWWYHYNIGGRFNIISIADATGHGASAAIIVALAYACLETLVSILKQYPDEPPSPAVLMYNLNQVFWQSGNGRSTMTMFIAVFDLKLGIVTYVNGGHILPICVPLDPLDKRIKQRKSPTSSRKMSHFSLLGGGTPLGYLGEAHYADKSVELKAGDKFIFYTDGLVECTNAANVPWGDSNLKKVISEFKDLSAAELLGNVINTAFGFFDGTPLTDDVTVTVVQIGENWAPGIGDL